MELKQLQSYCAVVKYKSFTKAAAKLFVSQPTVSTHIRQLEEEFSTQLIVRSTKTIEVTPRGKELYDYACNIVNLQENLLRNWHDSDRSVIRIGASTIPSAYILPEVLPAFRQRHPDVSFHVFQGDSQYIIDGMLCGNYDIGLIGANTDEKELELIPFYRDRMMVITPCNDYYRQYAEKGCMTLQEICAEPILLREKGSGSKKSITSWLDSHGIDERDFSVTARLNDQESIKNLVAGGLGISIISEKAAQDACRNGRIFAFPLPDGGIERRLYLATRRSAFLSTCTQQFTEFIRSFYKG